MTKAVAVNTSAIASLGHRSPTGITWFMGIASKFWGIPYPKHSDLCQSRECLWPWLGTPVNLQSIWVR